MHHLVRLGGVEDGLEAINAGDLPILNHKGGGCIHPGVHRDDDEGGEKARDPDREGAEPVSTRRKAIPAVEVDAQKDGFREEEDALKGKQRADDGAGKLGIGGPEQTEFKGDDRAGDGADDKDHGDGFGPATGDGHPDGIFMPESKPLGDTEHQRHSHGQYHKGDMKCQ